jgi:rubrerythrin
MSEGSLADALRTAFRFERENLEEYEKGAGETADPGVKAMFTFLAGEERRHMELIREMMRRHDVEP